MSRLFRDRVLRTLAVCLCSLILTGCSRAVEIPWEETTDAEYRQPGSYRIRLKGWNEYYARRFSVTDSTVVIEELLEADDRYKLMKHEMPIVIPESEVTSISEMKTNWPVTAVLLAAGATVVGFVILLIVESPDGGLD
jgi:hypothetical protein